MDGGGFDSWGIPFVGAEEKVDGSLSEDGGSICPSPRKMSWCVSVYLVCSFYINIFVVRSVSVSSVLVNLNRVRPSARRCLRGVHVMLSFVWSRVLRKR